MSTARCILTDPTSFAMHRTAITLYLSHCAGPGSSSASDPRDRALKRSHRRSMDATFPISRTSISSSNGSNVEAARRAALTSTRYGSGTLGTAVWSLKHVGVQERQIGHHSLTHALHTVPGYTDHVMQELYKALEQEAKDNNGGQWIAIQTDHCKWCKATLKEGWRAFFAKYNLELPDSYRIGPQGELLVTLQRTDSQGQPTPTKRKRQTPATTTTTPAGPSVLQEIDTELLDRIRQQQQAPVNQNEDDNSDETSSQQDRDRQEQRRSPAFERRSGQYDSFEASARQRQQEKNDMRRARHELHVQQVELQSKY
ncbi:hypothetical protein BCV69DRAFT_301921 [Microstroma glucosiphilum]|uniref:Uncharacterized protein n=1 Tax=Pseudomicrostroma glucosiphilum TaxID=1684307 RepID=A0A316TY69_9BASI|nr:hypothetical protein BCV69DRAFT_301921 [Pseudomicrostroma glucosiphilum]PWN17684.1 hypothetical protein BCV69DRAFT_301921 [Pseudomicrostroma glucosiphilum]